MKLLEKGKYADAFDKAFKNLEKGKKDRSNKEVLYRALQKMADDRLTGYLALSSGSELNRVTTSYIAIDKVLTRYEKAERYLADTELPQIEELYNAVDDLQPKITARYMELVDQSMGKYSNQGQKRFAIEAHKYVLEAQQYDPDNELLIERQSEIYEQAVMDFNITFTNRSSAIKGMFKGLEKHEHKYIRLDFDGHKMDYDCYMVFRVSGLGESHNKSTSTKTFTKEVLSHYETETDTAGVKTRKPVYKEISAEVEITRHEFNYSMSARVSNNGDCLRGNKSFSSSVQYEEEQFATSGDSEALPSQYKGVCFMLDDHENEAYNKLLYDLYCGIRNYYFREHD